jgi:hypothetical protein
VVNNFMVDAGTIGVSGFRSNNVSPRVKLITMAPHEPDRVRLVNNVRKSLVNAVASRGVVYRSALTTGARTGRVVAAFVERAGVRVVVFFACFANAEPAVTLIANIGKSAARSTVRTSRLKTTDGTAA